MANLAGCVRLHKGIRKNKIWKREPFTYGQAFCDLLLLAVDAQSAPQSVWVQGQEIVLERGQVGWSIGKLAEEWKRSRPWVMAFLGWARDQGMIEVDSDHRRTIITLINYDAYQTESKAGLTTDDTTGDTTGLTTGDTTGLTTGDTTGLTTGLTHKGKRETGNREKGKGKGVIPPPGRRALCRAAERGRGAGVRRGVDGGPGPRHPGRDAGGLDSGLVCRATPVAKKMARKNGGQFPERLDRGVREGAREDHGPRTTDHGTGNGGASRRADDGAGAL